MIDVDALRADTPGTEHVVHLNNAGAALMPRPVIDAVGDWYDHEARLGGYETRALLADRIDATYAAIAELIRARRSEISLADNATRAWAMGFYGLGLGEGDRILTTSTEYVSNLAAYQHVRDTKGVVIDVVPDTPSGEIDVDALSGRIDGSVKLITINHVPTNSGLVNPAAEVGAVAREHGVLYLLDACQSVGQMPIDVDEIGCDLLSATSRKFLRGPRGVGFLYVRGSVLDQVHPPLVELESGDIYPDHHELHRDGRRFETWEKDYAAVAGLGVACEYAMRLGVDAIWHRIQELAAYAREQLDAAEGIAIRDRGSLQGGIVTFEVEGVDAIGLRDHLRSEGINTSITTRFSSPIDMVERGIDEMMRASVHAYNTEDEIDRLVEAVAAASA